jgi:hypothetical protein
MCLFSGLTKIYQHHEPNFLKISTQFCPPKAKELDITMFNLFDRA